MRYKLSNKKRFSYCKFTIAQEKQIISEYQNGNSMAALGKKYNCDPSTIKNILKAYNIHSRTLSQARRNFLNYNIQEDIFTNIDNSEKAYWLGVMYSDGYITTTGYYTKAFGLSVNSKDINWLNKFKKFLNYNGEIHNYKTGSTSYKPKSPYSRLLIGNEKIVNDLKKWGVIEHKTKLIKELPSIDLKYMDDFIRGYIDGDGSLMQRLPHITICGNFKFLLTIAQYFGLPYKIYPDKSIYSLQYNANCSKYLEKRLYKNAMVYLDRKYEIAKRSFDSPITLEDVMKNSE